jgi:hypothetical protein
MHILKSVIIVCLFIPYAMKGQSWQQSVFFGPNISFLSSSDSDAYPVKTNQSGFENYKVYGGIGGVIGYSIFHDFPKTLTIGTTIELHSLKSEILTSCYCNQTMDKTIYVSNETTINSINVPMFIKLRSRKLNYTYIKTGLGLSFLISADRQVQTVVNYVSAPYETTRTEAVKESFSLKNMNNNGLGTFYHLGIGQYFKIRKIIFFSELSYIQDINTWRFKTSTADEKEIPIKRHGIFLKLGVMLKGNGKKTENIKTF